MYFLKNTCCNYMRTFKRMQWIIVMLTKMFLARLPITYAIWRSLGVFKHGDMINPGYAWNTFLVHAKTANVLSDTFPLAFIHDGSFNVLEIGPGDSVSSGIIARALGATEVFLIDVEDFVMKSSKSYKDLFEYLYLKGYSSMVADAANAISFDQLLKKTNIKYLSNGIDSMGQIKDSSIHYCFSNAVLQHIKKGDIKPFLYQLKRIMKTGSLSVHRIDLRDMLSGGLNQLRFSTDVWETFLFQNSGFYTNRLRSNEWVKLFEDFGLPCAINVVKRFETMPIQRNSLSKEYRDISSEVLLNCTVDLIVRH
jgi:hypothetical protein